MLNRLLTLAGLKSKKLPRPDAPSKPAPLPSKPRPVAVTEDDFDELVLTSDRLVAVDFWADWCGPCEMMDVSVHFLAQEHGQTDNSPILVTQLDVDENPAIAERYNLMGIPTIIFFQNGEVIDRHTGVLGVEELSERVGRLLNE